MDGHGVYCRSGRYCHHSFFECFDDQLKRLSCARKIFAFHYGKSTAEAYELAVKALGDENFTRYKITEELSKGNVKLIADILISGNGNGGSAIDGLLGLKLMEMIDPNKKELKGKSDENKTPFEAE